MTPKSPLPVVLDATLVEKACAGDRAAIDAVLVSLQRPFYNLALRMLGDRALAEDATQEALLRVVTHLSEFRGEAKLSTWATRVALNAILDFRSGIARVARIDFESFAEGLAQGRDPSAVERPEDALFLKQLKTMCGRALLHCLDGDHRAAFVLGEILELEGDEAAEVLAITPAAFRKRLSRARAELTAFLARECSVHTAGNPCACHRRLDRAKAIGRVDPKNLESTIGDLMQLRRRLVVLNDEERTTAYYRADEAP
ncbi:MAG TPA: sigma-70 family RNA polymerase sigma factor, partial [Polyangiaceae bacterium]